MKGIVSARSAATEADTSSSPPRTAGLGSRHGAFPHFHPGPALLFLRSTGGGGAGLGVNTSRGLSLPRLPCRWNAAPLPPPRDECLFSGFGGSPFSHQGKIVSRHLRDDARRALNETGGFQ